MFKCFHSYRSIIAKWTMLFGVVSCLFLGTRAHAQWRVDSATPKGTIGLGLVGAELGLSVPALAGLDETWSLITFPLVGAAGGALAGYFAVDKPGHKVASIAMLSTGLTLLVPSIILTVHGMRFDPDDDDDSATMSSTGTTAGLIRLDRRHFSVGMPAFWQENSLSIEEMQKPGFQGRSEYHVALMSGSF